MTAPVTVTPLLPCPFCGGENVKVFGPYGWYRHYGISHSCRSFYNGAQELAQGFHSEAGAIAAWNTRTQSAAASDAQIAELEAIVADAYYVLTYVQELAGDDVTRAACQSVRDQIDAHAKAPSDAQIAESREALEAVRDWMSDVWDTPQQPPLELVQMVEALFERPTA